MDWNRIDWQALERLRTAFLQGSAGRTDYWQSESDLASYDLTFAQRIGWKWDYVLGELNRLGWSPPPGALMDWGCGSGVGGRAFLDQFGTGRAWTLRLFDRSPLAVRFAQHRAKQRFPAIEIQIGDAAETDPGTLLLSHVLTELDDQQLEKLLEFAHRATAIVWVEPGTYQASRKLIAAREALRAFFHLVAPCPHQGACGILATENAPHWCHHFAPPPPQVFTDGNWARFASLAGVDLRSLPLSYLVLDKRPIPDLPPGTVRVIGRPRLYKAHALLLGCENCALRERRLSKRNHPDPFRQVKKDTLETLQVWECAQDEIAVIRPLPSMAGE